MSEFVQTWKWSDGITSVLVCDESAWFRRQLIVALEASPGIEVMAEADDAESVVGEIREAAPDVVWLGLRLSGYSGVRLTSAIREMVPTARVVVVAGPEDAEVRARALQAGAVGLVARDDAIAVAVAVTERVAWGRCALAPADLVALGSTFAGLRRQAASIQQHVPMPVLDARQRDVLDRLAHGADPASLASDLDLPLSVVENLVLDAVTKLYRYGRAEALTYAVGERLFDVG
jgi:two-component system nitrate/nitrite response regulator NarL